MIKKISLEIQKIWEGIKEGGPLPISVLSSEVYQAFNIRIGLETLVTTNSEYYLCTLELSAPNGTKAIQELYLGSFEEMEMFVSSPKLEKTLSKRLESLSSAMNQY